MAFEIIRPNFQLPVRPASNIIPRTGVLLLAGSSLLQCAPVGSCNDRPFGYNGEATAALNYGDQHDFMQPQPVEVREEGNIVKAIAGASFGPGAELTVATLGVATVAQGSSVATIAQLGPLSIASGVAKWSHGIALDAGVPGALFTLYFKPRLTGSFNA